MVCKRSQWSCGAGSLQFRIEVSESAASVKSGSITERWHRHHRTSEIPRDS